MASNWKTSWVGGDPWQVALVAFAHLISWPQLQVALLWPRGRRRRDHHDVGRLVGDRAIDELELDSRLGWARTSCCSLTDPSYS
jgi:hypothetical protein